MDGQEIVEFKQKNKLEQDLKFDFNKNMENFSNYLRL